MALAETAPLPAPRLPQLLAFLRRELASVPGRAIGTVRIVIACVVTLVLCMTLQVPEAHLSVWVALRVVSEEAGETLLFGVVANFRAGVAEDDRHLEILCGAEDRLTRAGALEPDFFIYAGGLEYEIAHNPKYVFAIHSRFNVDDSLEGAEEAEDIVQYNQMAAQSP